MCGWKCFIRNASAKVELGYFIISLSIEKKLEENPVSTTVAKDAGERMKILK